MLVALTEKKKLFQLTPSITETNLRQLRQTTLFYCPQCKERLQLKIGQIKIPHFAHLKNSACESSFSEGESSAHLRGKQQLFTFFHRLGLPVELEPYLKKLQQRPDLLVETRQRSTAIEFQCSRISSDKFKERTIGYLENDIVPLWILQTPHDRFKKTGVQKLSVTHFMQQFILQHKKQRYVITYDAQSEQFYYLSNLLPLNGQQYLGYIQPLPISKQVFPFYIPALLPEHAYRRMLFLYQRYKDGYIPARLLLSREGVNDLFLRSIYEMQLSKETLPCFIGIPSRDCEGFPLFSVEWQMALFYFMHCHNLLPKTMDGQAISYFFNWAKFRYNRKAEQAVWYYIQLLLKLDIQNAYSEVESSTVSQQLYEDLVAFSCEN